MVGITFCAFGESSTRLTETWLDEVVPDSFIGINGFDIMRCDRNLNGGGVALFVRNSFAHEHVPLPPTRSFKSNILACRLIDHRIVIFCIYHPYWGSAQEHATVLEYLQYCFDVS